MRSSSRRERVDQRLGHGGDIVDHGDGGATAEFALDTIEVQREQVQRSGECSSVWRQERGTNADLPALHQRPQPADSHRVVVIAVEPGLDRPTALLEPDERRIA